MPEAAEALKAVETSRGRAPTRGRAARHKRPRPANRRRHSRAPAETPAKATSPRGGNSCVLSAPPQSLSRSEAEKSFKTRLENLPPKARTIRNYWH